MPPYIKAESTIRVELSACISKSYDYKYKLQEKHRFLKVLSVSLPPLSGDREGEKRRQTNSCWNTLHVLFVASHLQFLYFTAVIRKKRRISEPQIIFRRPCKDYHNSQRVLWNSSVTAASLTKLSHLLTRVVGSCLKLQLAVVFRYPFRKASLT